MVYDKKFPVDEEPQPLFDWEDSDILGKCYNRLTEDREEAIRLAKRVRYLRQSSKGQKVMTNLIPLADSLDRILAHRDDPTVKASEILRNWLTSIEAIRSRLTSIMEREGLVAVDSLGKPVDLNVHEVVEVRGDMKEGIPVVVEEHQKGYIYDNKVVRDARVVVKRMASGEMRPPEVKKGGLEGGLE